MTGDGEVHALQCKLYCMHKGEISPFIHDSMDEMVAMLVMHPYTLERYTLNRLGNRNCVLGVKNSSIFVILSSTSIPYKCNLIALQCYLESFIDTICISINHVELIFPFRSNAACCVYMLKLLAQQFKKKLVYARGLAHKMLA